jgi:hypothetical protein
METTSEPEGAALPRTNPKHWKNISAEDIPPGWIDDMVKRLFQELNGQLIRVERASSQRTDKKNAKDEYEDLPDRAEQDARTLSSLQRSLAALTKMEIERKSLRNAKKSKTRIETREAIAKQIFGEPGAGSASSLPQKDQ